MDNIQSIATLSIIFLTLAIFIYRIARKKDPDSCGSSCHCEAKDLVKTPKQQAQRSDTY